MNFIDPIHQETPEGSESDISIDARKHMDRQKKKMLKASLFHHRDDISDWIREDPETEHFSGFEIIAAVLAFAAALATIDKGLESVDSLIERVKRLYRYVRHDQEKAEVEESPGLTEGERILAMVFDAYLDNRKGLSTEELAGRFRNP